MKRKGIAVFLTAMMMPIMLGGCSEQIESSPNNVAVGSAVTLPSNSAGNSTVTPAPAAPASTSTYSGAPTVVAPSFDNSEPPTPAGSSESHPYDILPNDESKMIFEDFTIDSDYYVKSGEKLQLYGNVTVEPGASIIVEDGAELFVGKSIALNGEIDLQGDGKLTMLALSEIYGNGAVIVGTNFNQIDCGIETISVHIVPPEREVINGATYVGGIVIANKAITLPPEFGSHLAYDSAEPEVWDALQKMNAEAPYYYSVVSGFRDYWSQQAIFQRYVDRDGYEEAVTYSAKQGHSEHQTGYTMDLDSLYESYGDTPEGKWLAENCWKYGFIIRYPKGKEDITGYTYEPWHVRWVGTSTAKMIYDSGLCLEEFFNVEGGWTIVD